jgi:crotonobetainyl-CoA:carnitine CoA-transferase CaiB-like acyl-CoA transferase
LGKEPEHPVSLCKEPQGPLVGYRVLELCSMIAGPACARLMADFGAEVIKIEPFDGDTVRTIGDRDQDVELYAAAILRNKENLAVDIKKPQGRDIVRALAEKCDIVVENFRPGTLERLGLGYEELSRNNPGLILVRISGYGQTGPQSANAGYGAICEAFAGVRHMTGDPDRPPARVALPMTDYLTAIFAAYGAVMALLHREKTGRGQVIDAALYEAAFTMMESWVPAYGRLGTVPKRVGSRLPGTAPNSLYLTKDGAYILVAANNDAIFKRLAEAMGRPELPSDPRYCNPRVRAVNVDALDAEIEAWTRAHNARDAQAKLDKAGVPASLVYTIADIFNDEHYRAREMLLEAPHPVLGKLAVPGIVPKLSATPGGVHRLGSALGADTAAVLQRLLDFSPDHIEQLKADGVIGTGPSAQQRSREPARQAIDGRS